MVEDKLLNTIEKIAVYAAVFLMPLFLLPIFPNPFVLPKLILLALAASTILIVKGVKLISTGKIEYHSSSYDLPVIFIALAYLASAVFITPNKMEAFLFPGTATIMITLTIIYFAVSNFKKKQKNVLLTGLFISTAIASLVAFVATSGILAKFSNLPAFLTSTRFTTVSGPLPLLVITLTLLPFGIHKIIHEEETEDKAFMTVLTSIVAFGFLICVYNVFFAKNAQPLLDFKTSWTVAVDSLKESPLLGSGPGNYLSAFNKFKPLTFNKTDIWTLRFTQSRSYYLTALTEGGIIAIAAVAYLLFTVYKVASKGQKENFDIKAFSGPQLSLIVLLISLMVFSSTISVFTLLFVLLATSTETKLKEINLGTSSNKTPAFLVAIPVIVGVGVFLFYSGRAVYAETRYQKALAYLNKNQGKETYDTLQEAIRLNKFVDRYHATYAQVNIALAQSLSLSPNATEEQRSTIAQLIQQGIREGKITVTLNKQRAGNWEILGSIYRSVMPFAEGADEFAIQAYSQAVALDPINPNLRINLGGIYYSLGRYDEAIRVLELSVLAKSDYANGHYNLAAAYRENNEIEKAINEMELVLSLVDENSQDYETAKSVLDLLEKTKLEPVLNESSPETLTEPQKAQPQVLTPPLELPEDAAPPATAPETNTEASPVASPTPTP